MPAERVLAAKLRVSRTVVARAYQSLMTDGRAVSRRGSGTCVAGAPAAPRRANTGLNYLLSSQGGKIDLNQAGFTEGDPPVWELMSIAPTEAARLMRHATGYLPTGLQELRERLATWYTRRGAPSRPKHFLTTNGAQQALSLLAHRFTTPARIVIENPTYAGASQLLRRLGHNLLPVACEQPHGVPTQALTAAAREPGVRAVLVTPRQVGTFQADFAGGDLHRSGPIRDASMVPNRVTVASRERGCRRRSPQCIKLNTARRRHPCRLSSHAPCASM
ncbi:MULTISPECIES: aminotransferase class I/II-fold pyridoxal phosphate-dependent enzyme [Streptomyces]|uniref:Aminotransferase class I/II-fold pyridoxal phosphate-dependent enzyme n=2 Tax=Streptomyces TaxID=1883 RepID=A0ABV9J7P0_9ACTN